MTGKNPAQFNNHIVKSLSSSGYAPPPAFNILSDYNYLEYVNTDLSYLYPNITVRANILALNSSYLFSYDAKTLKVWNKSTGLILDSIVVNANYSAGVARTHDGIVVDECNNVYVGGTDRVHVYYFNGTNFTTQPYINNNINGEVYDLAMNMNSNLLYVCGDDFISVTQGTICLQQPLNVKDSINICNGTVILKVTNGVPPYTFKWSNGSSENSVTVLPGKYEVTVTDNSCNIRHFVDSLTVLKPANVILGKDTIVCHVDSLILHAGKNYLSYRWNTKSSDSLITVAKSGEYYITVTDKYGCISSDSIKVTFPPASVLNLGDKYDTIASGNKLKLHAGKVFTDYTWQNGSHDSTFTVNSKGKYWVTVKDKYGCIYSDTVIVDVLNIDELDTISNVVTPISNWGVLGRNLKYFDIKIFNRWGAVVFEQNDLIPANIQAIGDKDIYNIWDGKKNNGETVSEDVYFYVLKVTAYDGKVFPEKNGTVTFFK